MTPDVNIRDYYLHFINSANKDVIVYTKELETIKLNKTNTLKFLNENKNKIKEEFGLDITKYDIEYVQQTYNDKLTLHKTTLKIMQNIESDNKTLLIAVLKYCSILSRENKYNTLIRLANIRKDMKFRQYQGYIFKYYYKVHEMLLKGYGYKYKRHLGIFHISLWNLEGKNKKRKLDYAATRKKKQELIEAGIKLFDKEEYELYKMKGIPYDGVDYRVYKTATKYYEFGFLLNIFKGHNRFKFEPTVYISNKYKGMTYEEIATKVVQKEDDIYKLQLDIKTKHAVLIRYNPNFYLRFVRNAEFDPHKFKQDYCKNR